MDSDIVEICEPANVPPRLLKVDDGAVLDLSRQHVRVPFDPWQLLDELHRVRAEVGNRVVGNMNLASCMKACGLAFWGALTTERFVTLIDPELGPQTAKADRPNLHPGIAASTKPSHAHRDTTTIEHLIEQQILYVLQPVSPNLGPLIVR
jgi:hypothetical protein